MLDIGFQEFLVLMVLALLVFGPEKLPELGKRLGRAMREFRRASDEFRTTVETNLNITDDLPLPPSATTPVTIPASEPAIATGDAFVAAGTPEESPLATPTEGAAAPEDAVAAALVPTDPFSARRGGRLLHRTSCTWVARIPDAERVAYKTAGEALELGLQPCPACDPREIESTA
jgi:TatA/E family protein of Tat protein translocase